MSSVRSAVLVLSALLAFVAPAGAAAAAPPAGTLVVTHAYLWDCPDGCSPAGAYTLWTATGSRTLAPLGAHTFITPYPPHVSPDGRWIAFGDGRERLVAQETVGLAGPYLWPRTVLAAGAGDEITATWSPDSTQLALAGTMRGRNGLWLVDRDGSNLHRIVKRGRLRVDGDIDNGETVAWSAQGGIAFVGERWPRDGRRWIRAIYVVRPDGSGLHRLTTPVRHPTRGRSYDVEDSEPAWSPDGRRLAFVRDSYASWFKEANAMRTVSTADGVDRPVGVVGDAPTWSPDGLAMAYIVNEDRVEVRALAGGPATVVAALRVNDGFLSALDWRH